MHGDSSLQILMDTKGNRSFRMPFTCFENSKFLVTNKSGDIYRMKPKYVPIFNIEIFFLVL